MSRVIAFALFAAGLSSPAMALETYMWGIGPRIGTHVLPGNYPIAFPRERGGDGTTGPRGDQGFSKVRHDMTFGGKGVYYVEKHHRLGFDGGAMVGIAMGPGRRATTWDLLLTYEYAIEGRALDILFGGGVGAGTTGFRGEDDQRLRMNTFPMRAQIAGQARDNTRAYEVSLFLQYNLPSSTTYTNMAGEQPRVTGGFWLTSGIQLSVMFGDFTPPSSTPSPVRRLPPE
jgi:hypothetical protein